MFTDQVPGHDETAKTVTLGPITGRTQICMILTVIALIEIKSTDPNKWTPLPRSHQMQELMGYMAMMDCKKRVYYGIILLTRKQDDWFLARVSYIT